MARSKEIDSPPKFPEQAERFRRAMRWARVASTTDLVDRLDGKVKYGTVNNRVQGKHEMKPIEIPTYAEALGVPAEVLTPGGPMLPEPPDQHVHTVMSLTGRPGAWSVIIQRGAEIPVEVRFSGKDAPSFDEALEMISPSSSELGSEPPAPAKKSAPSPKSAPRVGDPPAVRRNPPAPRSKKRASDGRREAS